VYDWVNPTSASFAITFGRVNASARKSTSGCCSCTAAMTHAQNAVGLVCGLSTRKIRTPLAIQKSRISLHASHSAARSSSRSGQKLIG
jgi:hypothetical protein